MPKTAKAAREITHTLSYPSKMPEAAFGISAYDCKTGSVLRKVQGSVCSDCYATKGQNAMPTSQAAYKKRLDKIVSAMATPEGQAVWSGAIAKQIKDEKIRHFRWHDSGDIQNPTHLKMIADVARATPETQHWLPTNEPMIVKKYVDAGGKIPDNLLVRLSASMEDQRLGPTRYIPHTSMVSKNKEPPSDVYDCPAIHDPKQVKMVRGKPMSHCDGREGGGINCRACWDKNVPTVNYRNH